MAKPKQQHPDTVADDGVVADSPATRVAGVEFPVAAADVLAHQEYDDRVVIVTIDGRQLVRLKAAS